MNYSTPELVEVADAIDAIQGSKGSLSITEMAPPPLYCTAAAYESDE